MSDSIGFLTFASDLNYLALAHKAGDSLRKAWGYELTIVCPPDMFIPLEFQEGFCRFVRQPFPPLDTLCPRFEPEWQAIYASPYEWTFKIDADMLFFKDWTLPIEEVKKLEDNGFNLQSARPYTFRNTPMLSRACRVAFDDNSLPDVYSALFFFNKSKQSFEFFQRVRRIFIDWEMERLRLTNPLTRPHEASTDVVYAMALSDMNIDALTGSVLKFVHMKSELNFESIYGQTVPEMWHKTVGTFFNQDGDLYIENYKQTLPFHYHVKEFMKDEYVRNL